ncbi:MAG: glycosyltransferase family 4 protein [Tissierellia bacterium]|nr:glycosyltransferase family 4 protein [Tissierellia bacterium]
MKILYLTNIPSPYIVNYFNELGKLCDLTVVFEKKSSTERNGRWDNFKFDNFNGKILKGVSTGVDSAFSIGVLKYLSIKKYDYIIITNPSTPTGIISILYMKFFRIPYILESEGGFAGSGKGIKERLKRFLMKNAKYYFSTNKIGDDYFIKYGAVKEKIIKYPFTSLFQKDILEKPLYIDERKIFKNEYNVQGEKAAVCIGRFIKLKNFDWLINKWKEANENHFLYLIGEGPEKDNYLQLIKTHQLKNVIIWDYFEKDKLLDVLRAFDILVHPTLSDVWGLVVNEALAKSLPVITTPMCIAGDEIIVNGYNGYISNPDYHFFNLITKILNDDVLLKQLSINALESIKAFTFENMAKVHLDELLRIKENE